MSETVNLHVGSIDQMGKRFVGAWNRLASGVEVNETHLTFFSLEAMLTTLSPKRLELLRYVHQHPAPTIAALAKAIGRGYKRVHDDVSALAHAGLIVRDENGIRSPYDTVQATVSLEE
jgi:predicted transcriptional regulator